MNSKKAMTYREIILELPRIVKVSHANVETNQYFLEASLLTLKLLTQTLKFT